MTPPPAAPAPTRERVHFETDVPVHVMLKFPTGKLTRFGSYMFTITTDQGEMTMFVPEEAADRIARLGGREFVITKRPGKENFMVTLPGQQRRPAHTPAQAAVADQKINALRNGERYVPATDAGEDWGTPPPPREEHRNATTRALSASQQATFDKFNRQPAPAPQGERNYNTAMARFLPQYASEVAPAAPAPAAPAAAATTPRMTAALMAAIDSCISATIYASKQGVVLKFSEEDIRAIAATIYINATRGDR